MRAIPVPNAFVQNSADCPGAPMFARALEAQSAVVLRLRETSRGRWQILTLSVGDGRLATTYAPATIALPVTGAALDRAAAQLLETTRAKPRRPFPSLGLQPWWDQWLALQPHVLMVAVERQCDGGLSVQVQCTRTLLNGRRQTVSKTVLLSALTSEVVTGAWNVVTSTVVQP